MHKNNYIGYKLASLVILGMMLGACGSPTTPEPILETLVVTQTVQAPPVEVIKDVTPTPEPSGPRTLVICEADDPLTLFDFVTDNNSTYTILAAIYDGPFDRNSYSYQPVILEKLPSLADGDAWLTQITVSEGDRVVDAHGEVVTLGSGGDEALMLRPAGGGEPLAYQGGNFEMEQLSASFTMLPNLVWSDGTSLTASDSIFAFNLKSYYKPQYWEERTASYQLGDDNQELTTVWTGLPGFLDPTYYINFYSPKPEHILGQYSFEEVGNLDETTRAPLGWGPYVAGEWVQGESLTLHRNPNYWRAEEGLPSFDRLVFRFIGTNPNAGIAALLAGECDILGNSLQLDDQIEILSELQNANKINASTVAGTIWEHVTFGIQHSDYDDGYQPGLDRPDFFSDVRTRQAFLMCMDRQAVVDTVTLGQSTVIDTYVPPEHPLFNPAVRHYDFDVDAGSALLGQVGWVDEDGDPATPRLARGVVNVPDSTLLQVSYITSSAPMRQQVTAILQQSLAECGIQADVHHYPSLTLFEGGPSGTLFGRRFDLGEFAWMSLVEPECNLSITSGIPGDAGQAWTSIMDGQEHIFSELGWGGQNIGGFVDFQFDQTCSTAFNSLKGQPEYVAAHQEAQRIFAEQLPIMPLFQRLSIAAARPDICNFTMDPTGETYWNIEEFDYGEGCVD
jgi:peptide/nickel transport system substrate-binding protein